MVSQDKGEMTLEGHSSLLVSELGALMHYASKKISEDTGVSYDTIISDINNAVGVYKLTEAGMTMREAMDTLDITDKLSKSTTINIDGTEEVIYEKGK